MYFARKTLKKIRIGLCVGVVYGGAVFPLAWVFPAAPAFDASFAKWFIGLPIVLITYAMLEWLGSKLLALSFWEKMPSAVRVLLLVFIIALVAVAAVVVLKLR